MTTAAGRRLVRAILTTGVLTVASAANLLACPVCFGAEESGLIDGAKLGVAALLAITLVVQGGFAGFFLYLRRRAKRMAELELEDEWAQLQRGSRTS